MAPKSSVVTLFGTVYWIVYGGVEAEKPAFFAEASRVVYGHPRPSKDPFTLGGEDIRIVKKGGVGHNLARAAQLLAQSGNTGRKIHRGSPLIGCCVRRPE